MKYNGKSVFDEVISETESYVFNDEVITELFGEEEDSNPELSNEIFLKIAAETENMTPAEAYAYFHENSGEGLLDIGKKVLGWGVDKIFGGGGSSGGGSSSTATSTATPITTTTVNPNISQANPITVTNDFSGLAAILSPSVNQNSSQKASSSSGSSSRSSSQSRSQTANQFNPQFNPYLNFNPYLMQQQMQQQQQIPGWAAPIPAPQYPITPVAPSQPCPPCPPISQQPQYPQSIPSPAQQIQNMLSNPQAMSMLTSMISANLSAAKPFAGAKENFDEADDEADDDTAEFLPILAAIASAVAPTLIKAAPSIIKGVGGMFKGRKKQRQPIKRYAPPPRFVSPQRPGFTPSSPTPAQGLMQQQLQSAPTEQPMQAAGTGGLSGLLSGVLPNLISLIQSPQITGALGNLVNSGFSALTNFGSENVPVSEAAILNAISEYAQMAAEELESLGYGDNLSYMRDSNGEWKYDPNIGSYRAEALIETINS